MIPSFTHRMSSSNGGIKELFFLFFPILFISGSSSLFFFLEKLLLARYAPGAFEAAISAVYVLRVFQVPCILLSMMAQVFVGRHYGAKQRQSIGALIWQFIWFSLLTIIIITPIGLLYGHFYFQGTVVEKLAVPYFNFLIGINFLYPLGAVLSCFYLGCGKTRLVLYAKLGSEFFVFVLSYLLIFGKWCFPSMGLMGGALSMFIGQGGFCLLLLILFLLPKQAQIYHTWDWRFKPRLFWEYIQPGLLRGLSGILNFLCWAAIVRLIAKKGEDFLLILSLGGSFFLFFSCFADAICQAMTTMLSQIIGAKRFPLLKQVFHSGVLLTMAITILLGIPLFFFPNILFQVLFPKIVLNKEILRIVFLGLWFSVSGFILTFIPVSYILVFKDTKFSLFMGAISWIYSYLFIYYIFGTLEMQPQWFWLIFSLTHFFTVYLYILRMKKLTLNFSIS